MAKIHMDKKFIFAPGRRATLCGRQGFYAPVKEVSKGDVWVTEDPRRTTCAACLKILTRAKALI